MSRAKAATERRVLSGGSVGDAATISELRRWANRGALFSCVALLGWGLYQGTAYLGSQQIERLTVRGDLRHIDAKAIHAQVAPFTTGSLLAADLTTLRQEIEKLPWVYRVTARRRWPAEIEVTLIEQRPLARWGAQGYLNHEGEYFAAQHEPLHNSLPVLLGPEGTEARLMRHYQLLAAQLESLGLVIKELSLDELDQVSVRFDSGVFLLLGAKDLSHRVARFMRLWEGSLPSRTIARVDLRYEHGAAVRFSDQGLAMQARGNGGEG